MKFAFNPLGAPFDLITPAGDSINAQKVLANGNTSADVALSTNASTAVLPVSLTGLAVATIYQATISVQAVIYEDASPEIAGSMNLTCDMTVTVDPAGNTFCGFAATQAPDLSRLVGTALAGATLVLVPSLGGFTVKVTRPSGIACHARCGWTTNYFEAVGVASDIPQAGTWKGGFWDADHGIAGTAGAVTGWASREGNSVLTASGGNPTVTTDSLTNTSVLTCGTSTLTEINARWAAMGGTKQPFIVAVQLTTPAVVTGAVANIQSVSNMARVAQVVYPSSTAIACYQYDGTNVPLTVGAAIASNSRITLVFVLHTDGNLYTVDSSGTSAPATCAPLAIVVDRLVIAGTSKLRRYGAKIPATANPLLEAQQLYTRLATMI
jgi:hypothetical protein